MNIIFSTNGWHGSEVAATILDCPSVQEYQQRLKDYGSNELIETWVSHENLLTEILDKLLSSNDHRDFELRINLEVLLTKVYRAGILSALAEMEALENKENRRNLKAPQTKKQEFWL